MMLYATDMQYCEQRRHNTMQADVVQMASLSCINNTLVNQDKELVIRLS